MQEKEKKMSSRAKQAEKSVKKIETLLKNAKKKNNNKPKEGKGLKQ